MKLLEDRIRKDGEVLPGDVLKINSFLNHQVDPQLMMEVGEEFKRRFKDAKITKVLTCEASGIAPGSHDGLSVTCSHGFCEKEKAIYFK